MAKKQIIDIDAEFDGVEFDELEISRNTSNAKRSETLKGRKRGLVHDNKARDKIRIASTGRTHSNETRVKLSNYHKGKVVSTETRAKISIARKGKKQNSETISKRSKAMKNKGNKIIVTPDGIFLSRTLASEHYNISGAAINYRVKTYPKEYYYISREEYIILTGKEI